MPSNNNMNNKNQDLSNKSRVEAPAAKPADKNLDRSRDDKASIPQGQKTTR